MAGADKAFVLCVMVAGAVIISAIGMCTAADWQSKEVQKACVQKTGRHWCEK